MSIDLARLSCLADYEAAARALLPAPVWAYLHGAAADGISARRNLDAFARRSLLPRVMRPVAGGDASVRLFGQTFAHPIFIAPSAAHVLAHPEGERATALAAAAMQTPLVVSCQASTLLEDIAAIAPEATRWLQLYPHLARTALRDLLRRTEAAGYSAIVLTVDAPLQGLRNEDQRQGFQMPPGLMPNLASYPDLPGSSTLAAGQSLLQSALVAQMPGWDTLAWLCAQTPLPILVKGILHPLDVEPALAAGAAGLVVSNHGGRTLDGVPASLDALPGIVRANAGRVPLLMDGGIRRGSDILKAIALGADAVLIGRPILHGLAVGGAQGVAHVLHLLRHELEHSMVLCGLATLDEADPALLSD